MRIAPWRENQMKDDSARRERATELCQNRSEGLRGSEQSPKPERRQREGPARRTPISCDSVRPGASLRHRKSSDVSNERPDPSSGRIEQMFFSESKETNAICLCGIREL